MSGIDGKTLTSCFTMVSKAGQELEVMSERLATLLREATENNRTIPFAVAHNGEYDEWVSRDSEDCWVSTDSAFNLPLKLKGPGRRAVDRYIGFQISMIGDGIAIPGNFDPLLHMYCWGGGIDFDDDEGCYIGFPFEDDEEDPFEVHKDRILAWGAPGEDPFRGWQYSLRLLKLKDEEFLRKYCVQPTLSLLKGSSVAEALPDSFLQEGVLVQLPSKAVLCGREEEPSS